MNRLLPLAYGFLLSLFFIRAALAAPTTFTQQIFPLNCYLDNVNNGVSTNTMITPAQCSILTIQPGEPSIALNQSAHAPITPTANNHYGATETTPTVPYGPILSSTNSRKVDNHSFPTIIVASAAIVFLALIGLALAIL